MVNPQVKIFMAVAESGSFSKAPEKLFVTPTAIMKQINTLEDRLGISLFVRTNHGLKLTAAGESFLQDAKYMAEYSVRAIEKAREIDGRENQKIIRVGTSVMTPARFVLDVWAQIQSDAPKIKIELIPFENTPENAREILKNLGRHIDVVAGIYDDNLAEERGFQIARLKDKKLALAVPITHPMAQKRHIKTEDLRGQNILFIRAGWNKYIDELRERLTGSDVTVKEFHFYCLSAFNRALQENTPIIAIDGWENIHPLLKIIPVDWDCEIPYGIMYSKTPSPQVKKFIEIVKSITKE